jgi:hypothetical protein
LSREISIYDDSSDSTKISYLVQEVDKITSVISEMAATDSQQLKVAIALVRKATLEYIPNASDNHEVLWGLDTIEQRAAV